MERRNSRVAYIALALLLAAVIIGVFAFVSLNSAGRTAVFTEVAKLSSQLIVIVLAGALVREVLDDAQRQRERRQQQDRETTAQLASLSSLQQAFVRKLIDETHRVDRARMKISANRTVRTWSQQMDAEIIEAYIDFRGMRHDLLTSADAGAALFPRAGDQLQGHLQSMEAFLKELIVEFSTHKKEFSDRPLEGDLDRRGQAQVWGEMLALPALGGLLAEQGDEYATFRSHYGLAVTAMRRELARLHLDPAHVHTGPLNGTVPPAGTRANHPPLPGG